MSLVELFLIAVGLSMDAFAVSVCKGLAMNKISVKKCLTAGVWFGGFQALMPLGGFILGVQFQDLIVSIDHWIAFVLLCLIGGNMVKESLEPECCECESGDDSMDARTMLGLAIATSIDALAVGVTFAFLKVKIVPAVSFIGCVTFVLSAFGVKVGATFGSKYKSKAELAGGVILILMGAKILLEHLGILVL